MPSSASFHSLLALVLVSGVCVKENKQMESNLYELETNTPVASKAGPRPLQDTSSPAIHPPARINIPQGAVRPYNTSERNGRNGSAWNGGPSKVLWSVPLNPQNPPSAVLAAGDRIVVQALEQWSLHDARGQPLRTVARGEGEIVIEDGLVYYTDHKGFFTGARLLDGEPQFLVGLQFGSGFSRTLLWREGPRLAVHGFQIQQMSEERQVADQTLLEVVDLGAPMVVDDFKFVTSSTQVAGLSSRTLPFLFAATEHQVVTAIPRRLYLHDATLSITADYQASFSPIALSLDENAFALLVVESEGNTFLWSIDLTTGSRHLTTPLPSAPLPYPPLVGPDHRAFVMVRDGVVAVDPDGTVAWHARTSGSPVGATVCSNGVVVVSAGSSVVAIDPKGESEVVLGVDAEIVTAPVVVSGTQVLVASAGRLVMGGR